MKNKIKMWVLARLLKNDVYIGKNAYIIVEGRAFIECRNIYLYGAIKDTALNINGEDK